MNDDAFLNAFETCALEEFHHRDHIKVAYLYLRRYPLAEAIAKVRSGLQSLAAAWAAPVDDLEKGYHETMTQAWVRLVHLKLIDPRTVECADAFCDRHPDLMQKNRLEMFYSRARAGSLQQLRSPSRPRSESAVGTRPASRFLPPAREHSALQFRSRRIPKGFRNKAQG
jgi:hypothetical protein